MMTYDEVAAELRVSKTTVKRKVAEGKIRVVKIGPRLPRVTRRELDAYIAHLEGRRAA